ncbi:RagB/SusD family nutrient uptake outer membrane protein [Hymenobacter sp.]|uniref:RagB/SusD family nutrient uptake outer membrane protein n=1 Tax=Hymenobacter sp. TaxID=1898978 RepID=UPI00286A82BF|nr:RagB/SusD family nutrient uptake outer membrane protein [Hymenobacter sp.]
MTISKYTCGALLLTLGLLTGCGEKFLEEAPTDQITDVNFYKTENDAIQAVTASYSELTKEGQYNLALWGMDIMADVSTTGGGGGSDGIEYTQLDDYNIPTTNTVANRLWSGCFIGLQRANLVLQKVPDIAAMNPAIKKRCLGEAQFLRAKYYFDLVRAYGDVPLFTTPPANAAAVNIPRTAAAEVYKQIEQDLTDAFGNLEPSYSGADLGRATKWAAAGLLAKVYLTEGNKPDAAKWALEVIKNSGKSLWANYGDNFKVENENGKESLFEVQYVSGRNGYDRNNVGFSGNEFFAPRGSGTTPAGGGYGFNIPEPDFVAGYEAGDTRKAVTIWVPGDAYPAESSVPAQLGQAPGSPFGYNCKKWFVGKVNTNIWDSPLNIPVLRLADVYLILAEAVGPTGGPDGGLEAINKVRRRAFGLPIDAPSARDLTASTPNFTDAVLRERLYELAFEFDRWFDLKRTGRLVSRMAQQSAYLRTLGIQRGVPTDRNLVLPIPQSELDANPGLTQNDGY